MLTMGLDHRPDRVVLLHQQARAIRDALVAAAQMEDAGIARILLAAGAKVAANIKIILTLARAAPEPPGSL